MKRILFFAFVVLVAMAGCQTQTAPTPAAPPTEAAPPAPAGVEIDPALLGAFAALPAVIESADNPITDEKVTLGRTLYFDKRFSKNHDLSCNSCHLLTQYGVDNKATSPGHKGQLGERNSPTVYNAAGEFVQFWDGRAPTVEEQAKGPVLNPVEMALADDKAVLAVINSIPEYIEMFKKAFPADAEPVTYDNFGRAIGAFERKLVTPSKWDKFVAGDMAALNDAEKAGFKKFVEVGCTACHTGALLGGHMFQKLGLVKPWPDDKDPGRAKVTQNDADKMFFKVPMLRNIEKTGPYYHNGSVATLEEAVKLMGEHQLGKTLSDADIASIVTFLKTLTGELPAALIAEPPMPPSTDKTPKPDPA